MTKYLKRGCAKMEKNCINLSDNWWLCELLKVADLKVGDI